MQPRTYWQSSSCPALCRASTSSLHLSKKDVDGRDKPGHDGKIIRRAQYAAYCAASGARRANHLSPAVSRCPAPFAKIFLFFRKANQAI
jgi:hypothetical protein